MTGALIILAVTVLTGLVLYLTRGRSDSHDAPAPPAESDREDSEGTDTLVCCGRHEICEKGLPSPEDLYYDDEELDRFRGHDAATYSDEEIEEFRRVLYTLHPSEVAPWGRALEMREVSLPECLRDEWIMLCRG